DGEGRRHPHRFSRTFASSLHPDAPGAICSAVISGFVFVISARITWPRATTQRRRRVHIFVEQTAELNYGVPSERKIWLCVAVKFPMVFLQWYWLAFQRFLDLSDLAVTSAR